MNISEKIMTILTNNPQANLPELVYAYLDRYPEDLSVLDREHFVDTLNKNYFYPYISQLVQDRTLSHERALYLKTYLSGEMYTSEKAAVEALPIQLQNAVKLVEYTGKINPAQE